MRIALFGGSFDPPHCGHIGIAEAAAHHLRLDRVLMAPVGCQPLKRDQAHSTFEDRLAMVRLACVGHPRLEPSEVDAPLGAEDRADSANCAPNYTYDTLQRLRSMPGLETLFCLIGADSLLTLHHWYRAAEAMFLAQWIVAARPGFALRSLSSLLPPGVQTGPPEKSGTRTRVPIHATASKSAAHSELWLLPDLDYQVSATELRKALADQSEGIPQRVLDPQVAEYARSHRLYERDLMMRLSERREESSS